MHAESWLEVIGVGGGSGIRTRSGFAASRIEIFDKLQAQSAAMGSAPNERIAVGKFKRAHRVCT